jgi:uncharacterized protein (DUF927 family)
MSENIDNAAFEPDGFEMPETGRISPAPDQGRVTAVLHGTEQPMPMSVSPPSFIHCDHGTPTAPWDYKDADGNVLGYICRYDPPGRKKQFCPFTLWMSKGGPLWRQKSWGKPWPLFGLDQLALRPDDPILVVEGEKKVVGLDGHGGAAALLPSHVVITSPGGAGSAKHADWSPVAGRDLVIWPDADESGATYAKEVAAQALAAGAHSVRIVDVSDLPKGFDLADDLPENLDIAARIASASDATKRYISFSSFTMDEHGLTVEVIKGRDKGAATERIWVCAPFEILGRVRDPNGSGWARLIRWHDRDGRPHEHAVGNAALHGDVAALVSQMAGKGLTVSRTGHMHLANYLNQVEVDDRLTQVRSTGWHSIHGSLCFVLLGAVIGAPAGEQVILESAHTSPYGQQGNLEQWRDSVGALVAPHGRGRLAVSIAFAGPLLYLLNAEGGGIHLVGQSSRGKTTLQRAGASVWGRGAADPGFIRSWRATANAQEGAAYLVSDTLLALDEVGVAEAKDTFTAIYQLAAGVGKSRLQRDGSPRPTHTWRAMILSTGEVPIAVKIAEDHGRKTYAGQGVRMLDIPADAGHGFGVFDNAGPHDDPSKLAEAIKLAATNAYGAAGPAFVRCLIDEGLPEVALRIRGMITDFVEAYVPANADAQVRRAAERLALIGAAGELARGWGIVPWYKGQALESAAQALEDWIALRGGSTAAEETEALAQVRRFFEAHGEARFGALGDKVDPVYSPDGPPIANRAGWRRGSGERREWLVLPEVWRTEICKGFDPTGTARLLAHKGFLRRPDKEKKFARVERTPLGSLRVYVITAAILDSPAGEEWQ